MAKGIANRIPQRVKNRLRILVLLRIELNRGDHLLKSSENLGFCWVIRSVRKVDFIDSGQVRQINGHIAICQTWTKNIRVEHLCSRFAAYYSCYGGGNSRSFRSEEHTSELQSYSFLS